MASKERKLFQADKRAAEQRLKEAAERMKEDDKQTND